MIIKYFLVPLLSSLILLGCQNQESKTETTTEKKDTIEQEDSDKSEDNGFIKKLFSSTTKEEKLAKKEAKGLNKMETRIYGWHPYWMNDSFEDYQYNLLTTVSYYCIEAYLSPQNNVGFKENGFDNDSIKALIDNAHIYGCHLDLSFKSDDPKVIDLLLKNKLARSLCIRYITELARSPLSIDGICLVFENIPANNSASLTNFISELKHALQNSDKTIRLALPARDFSNNFDILKLNEVVDWYVLMALNYHQKGTKEGAVTPLEEIESRYHLKGSVKEYLAKGVPYDKLIVTLPNFGIVWQKPSDRSASIFDKHITYSQIMNQIEEINPVIHFDSISYTNYYDYEENGELYRCYFDNANTLEKKYKWLVSHGVAGIGIWALGYDQGSNDLWNMIDKNFNIEKLASKK